MITVAPSDSMLITLLTGSSNTVKQQLDTALQQESTGLVATTYGGLGAQARVTLNLRPQVQHAQTWQNNVDDVSSRLDVTQSALTQISTIAANFFAQTNNLNDVGVSEAANVASSAKNALTQVIQLLNSQVGGVYVFAGQDTSNPPIPNTDTTTVANDLLASDTATPPFSATLGTAVPQVEVGEGQFVSTGLLANQNTLATSAAPTTGSYMRDIMRALATLSTVTDGPTLQATALDTHTRLQGAISAMANETGALGTIQATLKTRQTTLAATQTTLSGLVSNVEDVDMAATLTHVSTLQTQLQASYQVIASLKGMSLASYI